MTLLADRGTGLERISRETLLILFASLNREIAVQASIWSAYDASFAASMGRTYTPITIEPVPSRSFFAGHRPSLIESPSEWFPNVSVYAPGSAPSPYQLDQLHGEQTTLHVQAMAKAGPYAKDDVSGVGEELLWSRINRTLDAVIYVMVASRGINGLVMGLTETPTVEISEVFVRPERDRSRFFWQAGRVDFTVYKSQANY